MKTYELPPERSEELVALFNAYRVFYEKPSDLHAVRLFVHERLERRDSHFIGAEIDGRLVGFTQLYPSYSSVRMRRIWVLNDLFVAPRARRRGVARALMRAALRHATETGAAYLTLETARDNAPAQALYLEEGWTVDESFLHFSRETGV